MYQRMAVIHSLDRTEEKTRLVEIVRHNGNNDVVARYNGKLFHAVDNPFTGYIYVDDIYGEIKNA